MTDNDAGPGMRYRRRARHEEQRTQTRVAELLKRHLPTGCFASALDNKPRSAFAGWLAKLRGVRAGLPDWLFVWRGEIILIELKAPHGIASKAQRQIRDELLAAGVKFWFLARSARACLMALHWAGVPLTGYSPPERMECWEGPFQNPYARLPQHPRVLRERAAAQKRFRLRKAAREAAQRAAAGDVPSLPNGGGVAPARMARIAIPPPAAAVNTVAAADRSRDRHKPGYMAAYMRRRRAAASQARRLAAEKGEGAGDTGIAA